jgi:hypothetical protein
MVAWTPLALGVGTTNRLRPSPFTRLRVLPLLMAARRRVTTSSSSSAVSMTTDPRAVTGCSPNGRHDARDARVADKLPLVRGITDEQPTDY